MTIDCNHHPMLLCKFCDYEMKEIMTDDKKPASESETMTPVQKQLRDALENLPPELKPASPAREWKFTVYKTPHGCDIVWDGVDIGSTPAGEYHVTEISALRKVEATAFELVAKVNKRTQERDAAIAEAAELKNNLPLESAWSRLKDAQARIAELEPIARSWNAKCAEHAEAFASIKQERDAALAEVERLRGDRDKFLASDDCYYWTPESQAERDRYKLVLESAAKDRGLGYDEFIEMHLESIKGGV